MSFVYPKSCNQLHYAQQECLLFYMKSLHNKFLVKTFLIIHGTPKSVFDIVMLRLAVIPSFVSSFKGCSKRLELDKFSENTW